MPEETPVANGSGPEEVRTAALNGQGDHTSNAPASDKLPDNESQIEAGDSSTEVKSQVKKEGGVKYEVIISQPSKEPPQLQTPPPRYVSAEDINKKLEAAQQRRMSIGEVRVNQLAERMAKVREAVEKNNKEHQAYVNQTRDNLETKMETFSGNRETYLEDMKTKLKEHSKNVDEVREKMNVQTEEIRQAIEEKLKVAAENRDENLKKMLEKLQLREHEEYCKKMRENYDKDVAKLEASIQEKLLLAQQKRESQLEKKLEPVREVIDRQAEVQRALVKADMENREKLENKVISELTSAELKRQQELEKKLEKVRQHDRHIEEVRKRQELVKSGEFTQPTGELTSSG